MADPIPPTARVTLAWDASPGPTIAGYRIYEGVSSGIYTNVTDVGNATSATLSNLVVGTTYYFAVSAYDIVELESALSTEISYTVTAPLPRLQLVITPRKQAVLTVTGRAGSSYELLASSDLRSWFALSNLTMDTNGSCQFTDPASTASDPAGRYYRLRQTSP